MSEVTQVLERVEQGDAKASAELLPLVYDELRRLAAHEIILQLNDALEELQQLSAEQAEIVKLRFFAGFSDPEIADILNLSERSIQRHWSYAKAWLFDRIGQTQSSSA